MDVITAHYAVKGGTGREGGKKLNSNRAGKGIGANDCNSDVRSREITVMNVMVGFHLWEKRRDMDQGGGSLKAWSYAGLTRSRRRRNHHKRRGKRVRMKQRKKEER